MQEVEQHLEDNHVDRGDTQRSIGFYKVKIKSNFDFILFARSEPNARIFAMA